MVLGDMVFHAAIISLRICPLLLLLLLKGI